MCVDDDYVVGDKSSMVYSLFSGHQQDHFVQYSEVSLSQGLLMYRACFNQDHGKCPLYHGCP